MTAFKFMHTRSTQSHSPCRTMAQIPCALRRSAETGLSNGNLAPPPSDGLNSMASINTDSANSRNGTAALEQNRAAGGAEQRRMLTRSGESVTVSLDVTASRDDTTYSARLRFKSGGATVQRPVGKFTAPNRFQALKLAWAALKSENIAEKEGWSWVASNTPPDVAQKNLPEAA